MLLNDNCEHCDKLLACMEIEEIVSGRLIEVCAKCWKILQHDKHIPKDETDEVSSYYVVREIV